MKYIMSFVMVLVCVLLVAMGWAPELPEVDPELPVVEKSTKLLTNYYWGTSDEVVPGQAVLMPHASLTSTILNAQVNDEQLKFVMVYGNGQEIWSATNNAEYYGNANLTVETNDSIYKSIITETPEEPVDPPATGVTELLVYNDRHNGDRATWYGSKVMSQYPSTFRVQIDGCVDVTVINNGSRWCSDGTSGCYSGTLVKQSDVSGRGVAVVQESSCQSRVARIIY